MRLAGIAVLIAVAVAGPAVAAGTSIDADLDGDGAAETAYVQDTPAGPTVHVSAHCPSGSTLDREVAGPYGRVDTLSVTPIDPHPGREVAVHFVKGAPFSGDESVTIIAWRRLEGDPCAEPRRLWGFTGAGKPPHPGDKYSGFRVQKRPLAKRYPGAEIDYTELFASRGRRRTRPDVMRRTLYRYDAAKDTYVRYFRRVSGIAGS